MEKSADSMHGQTVKAAVFDFDGVIAYTEPLHLRSFRETLAPLGITITSERWHSDFTGIGGKTIMETLFRENGIREDLGPWSERRRALFMEYAMQGRLRPMPGLRRFLKSLHERGFRTAIASGSRKTMIEPIISRLGILGDFEAIVGGEDVKNKKPHPEPFLKAAELLGVEPEECVAFEDSLNGISSALAAGMRVICVRPPSAQALKYNLPIIDDFTDFPRALLSQG